MNLVEIMDLDNWRIIHGAVVEHACENAYRVAFRDLTAQPGQYDYVTLRINGITSRYAGMIGEENGVYILEVII